MPNHNFGPWTTSLTAGSRLELSAFWQSRLTCLSNVCAARPGISLRRAGFVTCAALLLTIVPHWQFVVLTSQPAFADETASPAPAPNGPQPAETEIARKNGRLQLALDKPTEVNFTEYPLADALPFIAEYHGITIRIDQKAIEAAGKPLDDRPVSLQLNAVTFRTLLNLMLEPESLGYYIAGGALVITTRDKSWAALSEKTYDIRSIVQSGVPATELAKGIQFVITPASWESAGGAGSLTVEKQVLRVRQRPDVHQQLRELLKELRKSQREIPRHGNSDRLETRKYAIGDLQQAGIHSQTILAWLNIFVLRAFWTENQGKDSLAIEGDLVVVKDVTASGHAAVEQFLTTLIERQRTEPNHVPTQSELEGLQFDMGLEVRPRLLRQQMRRTMSADFAEVPLRDAIQKITREGRVDIWIDPDGLRQTGISLSAPVTLKTEASCSEVLDELLAPLGLGWRISDEIIKVASRATSDRLLEPHVYRTKELNANGSSSQVLAKRIQLQIEPASWTGEDSNGRIYVLPEYLLVTHNARVQRKIEKMLESLSSQPRK